MRLRHFGDEQFLGGVGGLVFLKKSSKERVEGGGVFAGDDDLTVGKTMFSRITRRSTTVPSKVEQNELVSGIVL
jgi:hypothetical protein